MVAVACTLWAKGAAERCVASAELRAQTVQGVQEGGLAGKRHQVSCLQQERGGRVSENGKPGNISWMLGRETCDGDDARDMLYVWKSLTCAERRQYGGRGSAGRMVLDGGDRYIGTPRRKRLGSEIMNRDCDGLAIKCRSFSQGRALAPRCSVLTIQRAAPKAFIHHPPTHILGAM